MLNDPDFFEDKRNISVILCADCIEKFKDNLGSVTAMTCQVVNYPAHLRGKKEFMVLWGIIDGKPKDSQLFYNMFVDEILDIETNGCRVWDVIENKPFTVRVKLYKAGNGVVTDVVNGAPTSEKGASRSKKRREKKKAAKADELELASDYRSLCETKLKEFDPDIELPLRELEKMAHSAEARTLEAQTQARQMKTQLEVTEKELATARLKAETLQCQGEEEMEEAEEEKKPAKKGAAVRCGKKGRGIHGAVRVGCGGRGVGLGWGVDMRDQPRMSIPLWGGGAVKREERGAVLDWAAKGVGDGGETRTWVRWGGGAVKREERGAVLAWAAKGVGDGGETHTWVRWGGGAMKREERGAVLAWAAKGVGDGGETRTWVRWGGGAMKREERGAVLDWAAKGVGDGGETHTWVRWGGGVVKREERGAGVGDGGETRTWVRWGGGAMKREERGAVLAWAAKGVGDGGETHTWVRWGGGAMKREARCVLAMAAAAALNTGKKVEDPIVRQDIEECVKGLRIREYRDRVSEQLRVSHPAPNKVTWEDLEIIVEVQDKLKNDAEAWALTLQQELVRRLNCVYSCYEARQLGLDLAALVSSMRRSSSASKTGDRRRDPKKREQAQHAGSDSKKPSREVNNAERQKPTYSRVPPPDASKKFQCEYCFTKLPHSPERCYTGCREARVPPNFFKDRQNSKWPDEVKNAQMRAYNIAR
ncbi:hypothetical protein CYMTET_13202 [Cymbomonas tetramitiformis]|uniref:Uncharacterized protein n=1 Tax=Cymbomonas tetramitiformis TaxID=36881 RepID=A0AAE0GJ59_9CHLO|nr:hypothetical protein CYMTET_13202 [Cymbomonas tetramitiformis]